MKYYDVTCGDCYYSEPAKNNHIHCTWYGEHYWKDTKANNCKHFKSGYVTTAVCTILGKENFSDTLQSIKDLRTTMEYDSNCKEILARYDKVGPVIAKKIIEDYKKTKDDTLAQRLYDLYIEPTVKLYDEGKVFDAIEKYSVMEDFLEDYYHLKKTNYTNIGEARLIKAKSKLR